MANGNGDNGGIWKGMAPWMRFVAWVGVPSAIALGVIWSDRVQLVERMDMQAAMIREIAAKATTHYDRDASLDSSLLDVARETTRIVLAECLNNAKRNPEPNEAWDRCIGK